MSLLYGRMSFRRFIMNFAYYEYQQDHLDINIDFFGREACAPGYSFGPSVRENYVIHYILSGKGQLNIDNFTIELESGNVFILPKDIITFYQADTTDPWDYIWVGLSGTKIESYLKRSSLMEDFKINNVSESSFIKCFIELQVLSDNTYDQNIDLLMDSKIYQMLYYLVKEFPSRQLKPPTPQEQYFNQAIRYMYHHFSKNITIRDIYEHLNLSRSYFHHIFTQQSGISPQDFLMNLRMKKAGDLLIKSDNTITTISISVGYKDLLSFSKAFKNFYGLSPSHFKKSQGNQKYERLLLKLDEDPNRLKKNSLFK